MLNAKGELPLGATLSRPVEQAVAVDVAVGLDGRRDAGLSSSALRGLQANRCTSRVEAERVAPVIPGGY